MVTMSQPIAAGQRRNSKHETGNIGIDCSTIKENRSPFRNGQNASEYLERLLGIDSLTDGLLVKPSQLLLCDSAPATSEELSKPLVIELFAGSFGWGMGFTSEGYRSIGYDILHEDYHGTIPEGCVLVLQDVLTIHGKQFKTATCIVASPPCQEYSYMAMPWKMAKAKAAAIRADATGESAARLNALFNACFRIQREACEAAGHYIPMVVENVCGAQRWVGKARAHYGSYYLWGDVGQVGKRIVAGPLEIGKYVQASRSRAQKVPGFRFDGSGKSFQSEAVKIAGQNCSRYAETGEVSPHWRMEATKGVPHAPTGHRTNPEENGTKQHGSGREWFAGEGKISRMTSSGTFKRKAASAEIAKIPFPLSSYIARCFKSGHAEA